MKWIYNRDWLDKEIRMNAHIRHGDKGKQMMLIPTREYLHPMKIIQKMRNLSRVRVFVSTINELENVSWLEVLSLNRPRVDGGFHQFKTTVGLKGDSCTFEVGKFGSCYTAEHCSGRTTATASCPRVLYTTWQCFINMCLCRIRA